MLKSKSSWPILYFFTFILAISMATLTWKFIALFIGNSLNNSLLTPVIQLNNNITRDSNQYISAIMSGYLFGAPASVKPLSKLEIAVSAIKLKNTKLNLRLTGLILGEKSVAVITYKGKQGAYAVGEFIVNNNRLVVKLSSVHQDFVTIVNNGIEERLLLPKFKQNSNAENGIISNNIKSPTANSKALLNQRLKIDLNSPLMRSMLGPSPKAAITSNPLSLSKFLQISPNITEGNLKGYAIAAGPDKRLMENSGIQAGDIVTHIDGDAAASLNVTSLYQKLLTNNSFNLTIDRNGSTIYMDIKL